MLRFFAVSPASVVAVIALTGCIRPTASEASSRVQLALDTTAAAGATYASAWSDGPVVVARRELDEGRVVFTRTFPPDGDGCTWRATETVTPGDDGTYAYRYEDGPVDCASKSHGTVRVGTIDAVTVGDDAPLTPATAASTSIERGPEACGTPPVRVQH